MSNDAAVAFLQWTASGGDDIGSGSFSAWTATGAASGGPIGAAEWSAWTSSGDSSPGARAAVSWSEWTATGESHSTPQFSGAVEFSKWTAVGYDRPYGAGVFEAWAATSYSRSAVNAAASFEAWVVNSNTGFPSFEAWTAQSTSSPALSEVYSGRVMNARNSFMTEYTNYSFNSFAKIGTSYYAAGPSGLFRLDGATDNGTNIDWTLRTGQHDDKDPGLKRLPEVLVGLRSTAPIRARIRPDDNLYYDYMIPATKKTTLYQTRAKAGKGMRSRYFAVELQGTENADLELDSMQINMTKTSRRLG